MASDSFLSSDTRCNFLFRHLESSQPSVVPIPNSLSMSIDRSSSGYFYVPLDPRYETHPRQYPPFPDTTSFHYLPTDYIPNSMTSHSQSASSATYGHHDGPVLGQLVPAEISHTSDVNAVVTDYIRRRCFNCCTSDTSTWRRSTLCLGKIVCPSFKTKSVYAYSYA